MERDTANVVQLKIADELITGPIRGARLEDALRRGRVSVEPSMSAHVPVRIFPFFFPLSSNLMFISPRRAPSLPSALPSSPLHFQHTAPTWLRQANAPCTLTNRVVSGAGLHLWADDSHDDHRGIQNVRSA